MLSRYNISYPFSLLLVLQLFLLLISLLLLLLLLPLLLLLLPLLLLLLLAPVTVRKRPPAPGRCCRPGLHNYQGGSCCCMQDLQIFSNYTLHKTHPLHHYNTPYHIYTVWCTYLYCIFGTTSKCILNDLFAHFISTYSH